MEEKVVYSDENGIRISNSKIYVGEESYLLENVRKIWLRRKPAPRLPGMLFFLTGILGIVLGSLKFMGSVKTGWEVRLGSMDSQIIYISAGVVAILGGIVLMVITKDKYAVNILTRQGKYELILTSDRAYAAELSGLLKKYYHRFTPVS